LRDNEYIHNLPCEWYLFLVLLARNIPYFMDYRHL